MNGPEHYGAAEQVLDDLDTVRYEFDSDRAEAINVAQVHATLALAAATALADGASLAGTRERDAWREVTKS